MRDEDGVCPRRGSSMRRVRSVTGPLRRAHPASGATWNVQVVRGKMSSQCLWHACRALSAGLLLMLLGAAMAVIGYYADILSVDQEIRGNATVSVKDEARGFHLNNLSYVGPIVMGFGGFIVVAACVMTFEARDSAAKVTPARPTALPRPLPRRGPVCAARLDQLGVYRLPHALPLPHSLPLVPLHRHRPLQPSASAAESECGSQSSLALDLHASGACAGVTLRVRDNTRRRPLARQQRLRDDTHLATPRGSTANISNEETMKTPDEEDHVTVVTKRLSVEAEARACSAPPPRTSPSLTPTTPPPLSEHADTRISIPLPEQHTYKIKQETEKQTDSMTYKKEDDDIAILPLEVVLNMEGDVIFAHEDRDGITEEEIETQIGLRIMEEFAQAEEMLPARDEVVVEAADRLPDRTHEAADNVLVIDRRFIDVVEVTGYPSLLDLNISEEFSLERLQEELDIDILSRFDYGRGYNQDATDDVIPELDLERQYEEAIGGSLEDITDKELNEATDRESHGVLEQEQVEPESEKLTEIHSVEASERPIEEMTEAELELTQAQNPPNV